MFKLQKQGSRFWFVVYLNVVFYKPQQRKMAPSICSIFYCLPFAKHTVV